MHVCKNSTALGRQTTLFFRTKFLWNISGFWNPLSWCLTRIPFPRTDKKIGDKNFTVFLQNLKGRVNSRTPPPPRRGLSSEELGELEKEGGWKGSSLLTESFSLKVYLDCYLSNSSLQRRYYHLQYIYSIYIIHTCIARYIYIIHTCLARYLYYTYLSS